MNKKEKEQLLEILKSGISFCIANKDYSSMHIKIEKILTNPNNIKLIRKWASEQ